MESAINIDTRGGALEIRAAPLRTIVLGPAHTLPVDVDAPQLQV
jgi:hypothetical protein